MSESAKKVVAGILLGIFFCVCVALVVIGREISVRQVGIMAWSGGIDFSAVAV